MRVFYIVLPSATNGLAGAGGLTHVEVIRVVIVESESLVNTVAAESVLETIKE